MADLTETSQGTGTLTQSRRVPTPIGTQRVLQIVLGVFWILDAALQYQPFMFGNQFVPTFITANASGQPQPISWLITNAAHFISPDVAVWNTLFATVQLAIGVGLLFPRTVRPRIGDVVLLGCRGLALRRGSWRPPAGFGQRSERRTGISLRLWVDWSDGLAQ